MAFTFHTLQLFQDLRFSKTEGPHVMKAEEMSTAICKVTPRDMEPVFEDYLTDITWCGYGFIPGDESPDLPVPDAVIPAGMYLFMQDDWKEDEKDLLLKAAEALSLEGIWQEKQLEETVYIRKISEGSRTVFQLFRMIL